MRQRSINFGLIGAVLLVFAMLAAGGEAVAQAAKDLKCKGCVNSKDIGNGKVKAKDLHDSAKPSAVASSAGTGEFGDATGTPTAIRTVTVNAPGPGAVVAIGSVLIDLATDGVLCKIATTVTAVNASPVSPDVVRAYKSDALGEFGTIALQDVFPVTKGNFTAHLVWYRMAGAGTPGYWSPALTLLFVPDAQSVVKEVAGEADSSLSSEARLGRQ